MILCAMGILIVGTMTVAPNCALSDPSISALDFSSCSAKLYKMAKSAISNVDMSANVVIQAGANFLHFGQSSGSRVSSTKTSC